MVYCNYHIKHCILYICVFCAIQNISKNISQKQLSLALGDEKFPLNMFIYFEIEKGE